MADSLLVQAGRRRRKRQKAQATAEFGLIEGVGLAVGIPSEAEGANKVAGGHRSPGEFPIPYTNRIVAIASNTRSGGRR